MYKLSLVLGSFDGFKAIGSKMTGDSYCMVHLTFSNKVAFSKKFIPYKAFEFIIDIGSSLGLWLGLSALSITDLAIESFTVVKKWIGKGFKKVKTSKEDSMPSNYPKVEDFCSDEKYQ